MTTWEVYVSFMVEARSREEAVDKVKESIKEDGEDYDVFEVRALDNA